MVDWEEFVVSRIVYCGIYRDSMLSLNIFSILYRQRIAVKDAACSLVVQPTPPNALNSMACVNRESTKGPPAVTPITKSTPQDMILRPPPTGVFLYMVRSNTLPLRRSDLRREEGMLQRVGRLDSLLRVERQAVLKQVDEMVEVPSLGVVHSRRCGEEAGAQITRRFDDRQDPGGCLYGAKVG
ncbi:hypothetical protein LZ32DRAFT_171845 [Colletotrichum eremochloae]|nr:hypothetical protein LZ32DRAFT_171845 [Colletotrichum eremochloae]